MYQAHRKLTVLSQINELREETQRLTDEDSDLSDDDGSTPTSGVHHYGEMGDHHGFVLGYRSTDVDLSKLHPLPSQIPFYWQTYMENVDPLLKILHGPTTGKLVREIRSDMTKITPGQEALMFSIYYGAITSMDENEVRLRLFDKDFRSH